MVSIDEDNNISYSGSKIFLVTPYIPCSVEWKEHWKRNHLANAYGWWPDFEVDYSAASYRSFVRSVGSPVIGPTNRFAGHGADERFPATDPRALENITKYLDLLKNEPNVGMWSWMDEPNIGGNMGRLPSSALRAITELCHNHDPNHPVITNFAGDLSGSTRRASFFYPIIAGSDSLSSDVFAFDYYPYIYQKKPGVTVTAWLVTMDRFVAQTYDLVPWDGIHRNGNPKRLWSDACPTQNGSLASRNSRDEGYFMVGTDSIHCE